MSTNSKLFRTASEPIEFEVIGTPVSQGSVAYHPVKLKGGGYAIKDGKPVLRPHHDNKKLKPWRRRVAAKARMAMGSRALLRGAVRLTVLICRPRPKDHYNAQAKVKPTAPVYPITRPDTLKIVRGIEDALTGVVWKDDSQVVSHSLEKQFSLDRFHRIFISIQEKE